MLNKKRENGKILLSLADNTTELEINTYNSISNKVSEFSECKFANLSDLNRSFNDVKNYIASNEIQKVSMKIKRFYEVLSKYNTYTLNKKDAQKLVMKSNEINRILGVLRMPSVILFDVYDIKKAELIGRQDKAFYKEMKQKSILDEIDEYDKKINQGYADLCLKFIDKDENNILKNINYLEREKKFLQDEFNIIGATTGKEMFKLFSDVINDANKDKKMIENGGKYYGRIKQKRTRKYL